MNLAEVTSINGKPLTKPEMNLLKKLATKHGVTGYIGERVVANRFTGVTAVVDGITAELINFVYTASESAEMFGNGMMFGGKPVAVSDFDRVRYLVMRINSKAYYDILD